MNIGFEIPTTEQIVKRPKDENDICYKKKARMLTELMALENGFTLHEILNPKRDKLIPCVTDVSCSIELLSSPHVTIPSLDFNHVTEGLTNLIYNIANSKSSKYVRQNPVCNEIINHANHFFSVLKTSKDEREGILTAFCIIPIKDGVQREKKIEPERPPEYDQSHNTKPVHPFFPEISGVEPFLGLIKDQLGEIPNFIRKNPNDDECKEYNWMLENTKESMHEHLLNLVESSSDDDFNPDEAFHYLS